MKRINELERSLAVHLGWNKSRMGCLARIVIAMIAVRTVNLVDIACALIPIFWSMVSTKGNSNTATRVALMNRFIQQFGAERIAGLVM